ncbi:unnamed protein product, partial [marine sediment metagenome]
DYAHGQTPPVLHRDIKPSNIMVTPDGHAKVLDFGIARELKDSMTRVTGKETSGTLLYMSPEQFSGKSPTSASDIYSFAATIYECLSDHPPFYQGSIGHQLLHMQLPDLDDVPEHVNTGLREGLAKRHQDRPASAQDLIEWLESVPIPEGPAEEAVQRDEASQPAPVLQEDPRDPAYLSEEARQRLVETLRANPLWNDSCERAANEYARALCEAGLNVREAASTLIDAGLTPRGSRELVNRYARCASHRQLRFLRYLRGAYLI